VSDSVAGVCPACGHRALILHPSGVIGCNAPDCPRPTALAELLDGERGPTHLVDLAESSYAMAHPMIERLDGVLFDCPLHRQLAALDGPPAPPGRYEVERDGEGVWRWTRRPS
jgi:hypothetical protein